MNNVAENVADVELKDCERQECEVWTRVMGYHRHVSEYNKGKKSEFYTRKCFSEEKAKAGIKKLKKDTKK